MLSCLLCLILTFPQGAASAEPTNTQLASRIEQLLHSVLTSDSDNDVTLNAQTREIFEKNGLPTIREVGDQAAYDFVVLLTSKGLLLDMQRQVMPRMQAALKNHGLPPDALVFYKARLRAETAKQSARSQAPKNQKLRGQIQELFDRDQEVRQQKGFNPKRMSEIDGRNALVLGEILDRYGVPTFALVGPEAARNFIVMIQHQPPEFRQRVLPKLKLLVAAGQVDAESYALVYDLSQRDMGKKQLYGERLECKPGEAMREAPIEDEPHVNQRRAELGLIRIELYEKLIAEMMPQFCPPATKPASD